MTAADLGAKIACLQCATFPKVESAARLGPSMDRFSARRKLLRGSLSAPLVLTVASPSALARTSFTACILRGAEQNPPAFVVGDDGFYRQLVPVYRFIPTGGGNNDYLDNRYVFDGGSYYELPSLTQTALPQGYEAEATADTAGQLVYFDADGQVTGAGFNSANGHPVTQSCWASFDV